MTLCFNAWSSRSNRNWFHVGTPARALSPAPAKRTHSPARQLWTRSAGGPAGGKADGRSGAEGLGAGGSSGRDRRGPRQAVTRTAVRSRWSWARKVAESKATGGESRGPVRPLAIGIFRALRSGGSPRGLYRKVPLARYNHRTIRVGPRPWIPPVPFAGRVATPIRAPRTCSRPETTPPEQIGWQPTPFPFPRPNPHRPGRPYSQMWCTRCFEGRLPGE